MNGTFHDVATPDLPRSDGTSSLAGRDARVIASAQKLRFFPLAPRSGSGAILVEADGRRLIDLSGSWGAVGLGHAHPAVVEAVTDAVARMPGASVLSQTNAEAVGLAEELIATLPADGDLAAYIGLSGTDANAAALHCAAAATGRSGVLAFAGSYHGGFGPAQDVSGFAALADGGPALIPYPRADAGVDATAAAVTDRLASGGIGAVIVEPVMSDGGVVVPPDGFLGALAEACRRHGAVLICDEVKVGLGRTGWLHAFERDGVRPDIVTFGKALGGGLPVSAAIGRSDVMNATSAGSLLTLAGNPVCAAAARAVLRTVLADDLPAAAAAAGQRLLGGLADIAARRDVVVDARGRGLIAGLQLADRGVAAKVVYRAYELGAVCYCVGLESDVIELTPPLVITDAELDQAIEILDRAIDDVERGAVTDADVAGYSGW